MSLLDELKRRKIFRVAAAYTVVAWLLVQVVTAVEEPLNLPGWTDSFVIVLLAIGFPITLLMSWAYNLTPDGLVKDSDNGTTARPRDRVILIVLLGIVAPALAWFLYVSNIGPDGERPVQSRNSIAVLPLANLSPDPGNAYFADGIHDDLLTQLAKIGTLKVISRTSVLEYRDSPKNMRQIGQELDVSTILEGSVRRAGDTVRITVQLIDATTDEHLWAETYDQALTAENIFDIQSEMATSIAGALQAALSPEDVARLNEVPTHNTRALNFYLSGIDYAAEGELEYFAQESLQLAEQQFNRAVEEDPKFALAWSALGDVRSRQYRIRKTDANRARAFDAIERALSIVPDLPEAHLAKGFLYDAMRDYQAALREYEIASRGLPGDARIFERRSRIYRRLGEAEDEQKSLLRAIELDPRNPRLLNSAAFHYWLFYRDFDQLEQFNSRALDIQPNYAIAYRDSVADLWRDGNVRFMKSSAENPPFNLGDHRGYMGWQSAFYERDYETAVRYLATMNETAYMRSPITSYIGTAHLLAGRPEEAARYFEESLDYVREQLQLIDEFDEPDFLVMRGEALVGLGRTEEGIRDAQRALEIMPRSRDAFRGSIIRYEALIRVFAPAGATDIALDELESYLSSPGHWSIEGLLPDPRLDPIRDDPRFQATVEKYRRR